MPRRERPAVGRGDPVDHRGRGRGLAGGDAVRTARADAPGDARGHPSGGVRVREPARSAGAQALIGRFAERSSSIALFQFLRRDLGPFSPWARFKRARAELDAFLYEEIDRRRTAPDRTERSDLLSRLLGATDDAGEAMTWAELRDELVTVLGAGHETKATSLAWGLSDCCATRRCLIGCSRRCARAMTTSTRQSRRSSGSVR